MTVNSSKGTLVPEKCQHEPGCRISCLYLLDCAQGKMKVCVNHLGQSVETLLQLSGVVTVSVSRIDYRR